MRNKTVIMSPFCQNCSDLDQCEAQCSSTDVNACGACRKLWELQRRIAETKMLLHSLKDERRKIKEQANHHHDPFIHRLPPEIASNIFEHCVPESVIGNFSRRIGGHSQTTNTPLVISAVCRRWRTIAHSTPQLWKNLRLILTRRIYHLPSEAILLFVQEWIDRAGELPLSIDFYTQDLYGDHYNSSDWDIKWADTALEIIDVLNKFSHRWLQLKYEGPPYILSHFSASKEPLPHLRVLDLTLYGVLSDRENFNLHPTKLHALSVSGAVLSNLADLDCHHLTTLTMENAPLSGYFEALRRAPFLIRCTFRQNDMRNDDLQPTPFVHPRIQHLEISNYYSRYHQNIFDNLSCPSVVALNVFCNESKHGLPVPLIIAFLMRSQCSLEKLSLCRIHLSPTNVISICQEITTLQHLSLSFFRTPESTLKVLLRPLAKFSTVNGIKNPRYLPSLRSLTLDGILGTRDWATLPNMFGAPSQDTTHSMECYRHALISVAISTQKKPRSAAARLRNPESAYNIDEETLNKILWLRDISGVKWEIQGGQQDMIALGVEWYSAASENN